MGNGGPQGHSPAPHSASSPPSQAPFEASPGPGIREALAPWALPLCLPARAPALPPPPSLLHRPPEPSRESPPPRAQQGPRFLVRMPSGLARARPLQSDGGRGAAAEGLGSRGETEAESRLRGP